MKKEIEVMYHLRGHPNIVELHEVYEDRNNIHLVMDLCTGKDKTISFGWILERRW